MQKYIGILYINPLGFLHYKHYNIHFPGMINNVLIALYFQAWSKSPPFYELSYFAYYMHMKMANILIISMMVQSQSLILLYKLYT